ncbi:MAG: hypothetical protein IPK82_35795 [Polyangiaceae bacterium]|nr:hypothetical protein [Polyangiaceae bacterium]
MALMNDSLKSQLENNWLVPEGGQFPNSVAESAQRFADAVVQWFSLAQANGIPCATAMARKAQLVASATGALSAQSAQAAGTQLAMGVAGYIAGQSFPPGAALFPLAASSAASMMIGAFSDVNGSISQKASTIASACTILATSTQAAGFPLPAFPTPMAPIV